MFEGAKKQRLKITFILLPVCLGILVVSYAYGVYARNEREKQMVPVLAIDSMVKGLRQYQRLAGQFPEDFDDLEKRVWKHKNAPDFGPNKRTLTWKNYYYVYAKTDALTTTIWAIPSGPKREEASTQFLVVTPDVLKHWKGPALSKLDIDRISSAPTAELLNMLGMTEQKMIDQRSVSKPANPF